MPHSLFVAILTAALLLLPACHRQEAESPAAQLAVDVPAQGKGTTYAAVRGALSIEDPLARTATLSAILQGLGPDAAPQVVGAYETVNWGAEDTLGVEMALLVDWWGSHDPVEAFSWLRKRHWSRNPALMRALVRAWATQDPATARGIVEHYPARNRGILLTGLIEGWFASGQGGLEEFLVALPPSEDRQLATGNLARRMVLRDGIDATLRWAEALPDDEGKRFKLQAYRRVGSAVAEFEPERAAAWVERQLDGHLWDGLPRRVGVTWAQQDGASAMAWLSTLPPDKLGIAVEETYRTWIRYDRERARAWIPQAVGKPNLEPAVALYALSVARDDPPAALPWVAKLHDETRRHRTLVRLGRAWMARDPQAAAAWLQESELTSAERKQVLSARKGSPSPGSPNEQAEEEG